MVEASPKETLDEPIDRHMLQGRASESKVKIADMTYNSDLVRLACRSKDEAAILRCRSHQPSLERRLGPSQLFVQRMAIVSRLGLSSKKSALAMLS